MKTGFWRGAGTVAGMVSGVLPVWWIIRGTSRAARAAVPPMDQLRIGETRALLRRREHAQRARDRFAWVVARQGLSERDLEDRLRRSRRQLMLLAVVGAALLLWGAVHPLALVLLPAVLALSLYSLYQIDCLEHHALPLLGTWLLSRIRRQPVEEEAGVPDQGGALAPSPEDRPEAGPHVHE